MGPKFHTSRWEHHHDLTDKVVAVVGTGSTATQVVPAIQPIVKKLYVFQREPGWVMPKGERDLTDAERAVFANAAGDGHSIAPSCAICIEKSLWGGPLFRPGHQASAANGNRPATTTSPASSPTVPTCAQAVTPTYPYPGQTPDHRQHVLSRAQEGERGARSPGRRHG